MVWKYGWRFPPVLDTFTNSTGWGDRNSQTPLPGIHVGLTFLTIFVSRMVRNASSGVRLPFSGWETMGKSLGLSVPYSAPPAPHEVRGSRTHAVRSVRGDAGTVRTQCGHREPRSGHSLQQGRCKVTQCPSMRGWPASGGAALKKDKEICMY